MHTPLTLVDDIGICLAPRNAVAAWRHMTDKHSEEGRSKIKKTCGLVANKKANIISVRKGCPDGRVNCTCAKPSYGTSEMPLGL